MQEMLASASSDQVLLAVEVRSIPQQISTVAGSRGGCCLQPNELIEDFWLQIQHLQAKLILPKPVHSNPALFD